MCARRPGCVGRARSHSRRLAVAEEVNGQQVPWCCRSWVVSSEETRSCRQKRAQICQPSRASVHAPRSSRRRYRSHGASALLLLQLLNVGYVDAARRRRRCPWARNQLSIGQCSKTCFVYSKYGLFVEYIKGALNGINEFTVSITPSTTTLALSNLETVDFDTVQTVSLKIVRMVAL